MTDAPIEDLLDDWAVYHYRSEADVLEKLWLRLREENASMKEMNAVNSAVHEFRVTAFRREHQLRERQRESAATGQSLPPDA